MTMMRKHFLALSLVIAAGVIFAVVAIKMWISPFGSPHAIRSERPLSVAEVKQLNFPFPATARNIQFAEYQHFSAYQFALRFEAPKQDCLATVPKAVEALHGTKITPDILAELSKLQPLTAERNHVQQVGDFPVPWFDPETIKEGVQAGRRESHVPKIWVDTARGVFYFQYTD
jgi:hypothetical protein